MTSLPFCYSQASTKIFLYGLDLIRELDEAGYTTEDFYVNPFSFKFMLVTKLENTFNEAYIELFFEKSLRIQAKFKEEFGLDVIYLFVQDKNLNSAELKVDGFFKISNE